MIRQFRTARRLAVLAASVLALGACAESGDDHEVNVDFMRITVGETEVTVNATGAVTGGPLAFSDGEVANVLVEFLNGALDDALAEHADEFQASVTPAAGVSFTRNGPFTGTLTSSATGTVDIEFALLHVEENHEDFGPFTVPVTVNPSVIVVLR
jgi:ABC-type amino acid transport substrate-binding protein